MITPWTTSTLPTDVNKRRVSVHRQHRLGNRTDGRRFTLPFWSRIKSSLFSKSTTSVLGPNQIHIQKALGIRQARNEAGNSGLSSSEIKNKWSCISASLLPSSCYMDNFAPLDDATVQRCISAPYTGVPPSTQKSLNNLHCNFSNVERQCTTCLLSQNGSRQGLHPRCRFSR